MKTSWKVLSIIGVTLMMLASCSKFKKTDDTADPNAKQHNDDVSNTKNESDNLNTEINNVLTRTSGFGKKEGLQAASICGASIDSSGQYNTIPTVIINFDGVTACGSPSRIRGGQVKVELIQGSSWSARGAKLRVTHIDYKVTFVNLNNHFVNFNGIKYLTNVDGFDGIAYYLTGAVTVRIKERTDNMTVTFENGQTASWNSARLSTWQVTGYVNITATVNGDTIIGGKFIDSWGVTRFNTNFLTEMNTPWKSGTTCGWWKPTQGRYTSVTDNFTVSATFGVDRNGNALNSGCPGYLKLDWTILSSNTSGEAVIQYF
ncbi:MAG: hypothetical protein V4615_03540 [Bacteroidota bacterium]